MTILPAVPTPSRRSVTMPLPVLTEEQRKQALEKAAEARKKRAELKGQLKSGKITLKDMLSRQGDDTVGKMKVSNVLESLPGVGKVRARKIIERLDISASRRGRGLGGEERGAGGRLFVWAGPEGVGKGTVVRRVRERVPRLRLSISATTRLRRLPFEQDGVDYFFVGDQEFDALV